MNDSSTHQRSSRARPLWVRAVAAALSSTIAVGPVTVPRRAEAAPLGPQEQDEVAPFADAVASKGGPSAGGASQAGLQIRDVPVGMDGSFEHTFPVQLPPGRLDMQPKLALQYTSGRARRPSNAGVGWALDLPRIERDTSHGAAALTLVGSNKQFDDTQFLAPVGPIVRSTAAYGPTGATGSIYVPLREDEPVRFEKRSDQWIEHRPSGQKRYYGRATGSPGTGPDRIQHPLGTFAWLLVAEEDSFGNRIEYDYHLQSSTGQTTPNPIVRSVRWGLNSRAGLAHRFEARTQVEALSEREIDLLHGNIEFVNRIRSIQVGTAGFTTPYWSYTLIYQRSLDTGRDLLTQVQRAAPGERTLTTQLAYTGNSGQTPFSALVSMPANTNGVYPNFWSSGRSTPYSSSQTQAKDDARSPRYKRGANKIIDFDGDGDPDLVYLPAGLGAQAARFRLEDSYRIDPTGYSAASNTPGTYSALPATQTDVYGMPLTAVFNNLSDLDGDGDLDGFGMDPTEERAYGQVSETDAQGIATGRSPRQGPSGPGGSIPAEFVCDVDVVCGPMCSTGDYYARCGTVDPFARETAAFPGANYRLESRERGVLYDKYGFMTGLPGTRGRDGAPIPGDPLPLFWPYCGCIPMCYDATCLTRDLDQTIATEEGNAALPAATPKAWISLNQAQAGGTVGLRRVAFRNWPPGAYDRYEVTWTASLFAKARPVTANNTIFEDINGDGHSDLVLTKYKTFLPASSGGSSALPWSTMVPRVYFGQGEHLAHEVSSSTSANPLGEVLLTDYAQSLLSVLSPGKPNGCVSDFECVRNSITAPTLQNQFSTCAANAQACLDTSTYPVGTDFNVFFLDLNADGLPDLVSAKRPTLQLNGKRTCIDGHQVGLNLGYAWETSPVPANRVYPESWSTSTALNLVRNRTPFCPPSSGLTPEPTDISSLVPTQGVEWVDLNADGRVDLVVDYLKSSSPVADVRRVFLNTGTGFVEPSGSVLATYFSATGFMPTDFNLAQLAANPGLVSGFPTTLDPVQSDLGRIVDVDGDGMPDLLYPAACTQPVNYSQPQCGPPQWRRNLFKQPDLLRQITTPIGGSTTITYMTKPTSSGRIVSAALPQSHVVVDEVDEASQASGVASDVKQTKFSYFNFVRGRLNGEVLGFERVTAAIQNRFLGANTELVTQVREQDVRPVIGALAIAYPAKGHPTLTSATSSGFSVTRTQAWSVADLAGVGARIRPSSSEEITCVGSTCVTTRKETTLADADGYSLETLSGDRPNGQWSAQNQVRTAFEYASDRALWALGRPSHVSTYGTKQDIAGVQTVGALLQEEKYSFVGAELRSKTRVGITPAGCSFIPADDVTLFTYRLSGATSIIKTRYKTLYQTYDADDLFLVGQSVKVTKYVDGAVAGLTNLTQSFDVDPRFGTHTRFTHFDGNSFYSTYDSLGRLTQAQGPNAEILAQTSYSDTFPGVTMTSTIYESATNFMVRRTHLDASGHTLAIVEKAGSTTIRRMVSKYDAFGRVREEYLARTGVASLDDYLPIAGEYVTKVEYDGFDRQTKLIRRDRATDTTSYFVRSSLEVTPRGYAVGRVQDWSGDLTSVIYYSGGTSGTPIAARYDYTRDGLGRVLTISDPDGTTRRFEYDRGGRATKVSQPTLGVSPSIISACYDLEDQAASISTAANRQVTYARDELGRPFETTASSGTSQVVIYQSFDGSADALGRLSRVSDGSGVTTYNYDSFGRKNRVQYDPAGLVLQTLAGLPQSYVGTAAFSNQGQISSYHVDGLNGPNGTINLGTWRYIRDGFDRVTSLAADGVQASVTEVANIQYEPDEKIRSAAFGSGLSASWAYDPARRYLSSVTYSASGSQVAKAAYSSVDPNGNVQLEQRYQGSATAPQITKTHTFDRFDRLATSKIVAPGYPAGTQSFTYTTGGNIQTAAGDTYVYGLLSFPQAVTNVSSTGRSRDLLYDQDGWVLKDTKTGPSGRTERRVLTHDASGCLSNVETLVRDSAGTIISSQSTDHVCNASGTRVLRSTTDLVTAARSRVVQFAGFGEIRPDEGVFLARPSVGGTVLVEDARDLSSGNRVLAESGYAFRDTRGSTLLRTVFNAPASAANRETEYDSWGAPFAVSGIAAPKHGYLDKEADPGDNYVRLGKRTYDPTLRRWLAPDPLVLAQPEAELADPRQLNLYAYATNNPIVYKDPGGEWVETAVDIAFIAADIYTISTWSEHTSLGEKVLDVGGLVLDVGGAILPLVPSVAGAGIRGARGIQHMEEAAHVGNLKRAEEGAERAKDAAKLADPPKCTGHCGLPTGGCFVAGTPVLTTAGLQSIETIKAGDTVWSVDDSGLGAWKLVEATSERVAPLVLAVAVEGDLGRSDVLATPEHPFFVAHEGWVSAVDLVAGDQLVTASGASVWVSADPRGQLKNAAVFNLRVAEHHDYFAGSPSLLVHNAVDDCIKSGAEAAEGGAKRGPKTDPNAPHNATIRAEGEKLEAEGNKILAGGGKAKEKLIPTPGGEKAGRRPDILYQTREGEVRGRNVGKVDAKGEPVPREKAALRDLNGPGQTPTDFVPY